MEIIIQTEEELSILFSALALNIVDAAVYYRLRCDLQEARPANIRAFSQSQTFWYITFTSLKVSCLTHLCRVYDTHTQSLNLVNLLDTIKANPTYFLEDKLFKRYQNSPAGKLLTKDQYPCVLNIKQLEKDIQTSSCQDAIVKKLMIWRHKNIAHTDAQLLLTGNKILLDNPLYDEEIKQLLDHSLNIFNKYSLLFCNNSWSSQIVGHYDYNSLLKFINLGLEKWDEDIEKQRAQLGNAFVDGAGV